MIQRKKVIATNKIYRKASFWARLAASAVDLGLFYLIILFYSVTSEYVFYYLPSVLRGYYFIGIVWLYIVFYFVVTWRYGQTPAKKLMRIRIVTLEYRKLTLFQTFLREVPGKIISQLVAYCGFLLPLKNENRQALHDIFANTYVIQEDKYGKPIVVTQDTKPTKAELFIHDLLFSIAILTLVANVLKLLNRYF